MGKHTVMSAIWWEQLRHDARTALRAVARRKLASGAAVAALAVGMGAPAAVIAIMLSISTGVFPGVRQQEQLVMLSETPPGEPRQRRDASIETVDVWRAHASFVQQIAPLQSPVLLNLRTGDVPEVVRVQAIGVDLLPLLGVAPAEGRAFDARDDNPASAPVALVSDGFVERRTTGRVGAVGSAIELDGQRVTIIGVMPIGFWFGSREVDIWVPIPERDDNPSAQYRVVARMHGGDEAAALSARLSALGGQVAAAQPTRERGWGVRVDRIGSRSIFDEGMPPGVLMLFAAAALGLLAACANIAMVMVARGVARQKETAVRLALGAARGRLVREFLAESLLVSMAGGAAALLIVFAVFRLMVAGAPPDLSAAVNMALDWRLVASVLLVAFALGVLSGLAPALADSQVHVVAALKETGYFGGAPARSRLRRVLIVTEVTITIMLLANTALLARGSINMARTTPGFNPDNLLALRLEMVQHVGRAPTPPPDVDTLIERISAVPGIESVAAGRASLPAAPVNPVSETYFRTLGLRLLQGREFSNTDRNAAVVVVSDTFARRRFANGTAVGERIQVGDESGTREIIGVVSDVMMGPMRLEPNPCVYIPFASSPPDQRRALTLLVRRTAGANVVGDVRRAVTAIDPVQTITTVQVVRDVLDIGMQEVRASVFMTTPILLLALLMAATGVYGLLAQTVSQRTHEFAVRIALGAGRRDLSRLVLEQGLRLSIAGAVVGAAGAFALERLLGAFLFGVPSDQFLAVAGAALLVTVVMLAAGIAPCRRALQIEPGRTLKYE
jgi:putative ABC transport system permease protein